MNIPMVSAPSCSLCPAISMAIALATRGRRFVHLRLSVHGERGGDGRAASKATRRAYVVSDSNLRSRLPRWHDMLALKESTGHSTVAITADGTPNGKLLGIVACS